MRGDVACHDARASMRSPCCSRSLSLGIARSAHADLLSRALGDGRRCGRRRRRAAAPPTISLAWAGPAQPTTLPDLLAARGAARAGAGERAARHRDRRGADRADLRARRLARSARSVGSWSRSGFFGGLAIDRATAFSAPATCSRMFSDRRHAHLHAGIELPRRPTSIDPARRRDNWTDDVSRRVLAAAAPRARPLAYDAHERRATLSRDVSRARAPARRDPDRADDRLGVLGPRARRAPGRDHRRQSLDLAKERLRITLIGNEGGKIPRSEIPPCSRSSRPARRTCSAASSASSIARSRCAARSAADRRGRARPAGRDRARDRATTADLGNAHRARVRGEPRARAARQAGRGRDDRHRGHRERPPAAARRRAHARPDGRPTRRSAGAEEPREAQVDRGRRHAHVPARLRPETCAAGARELRDGRGSSRSTRSTSRADRADDGARGRADRAREAPRRARQRAIDLANENIQIETDRFNLGKSTNFDVLNRQEELRQAELRKAQAMIDWHKAEAGVQALTGDILPALRHRA